MRKQIILILCVLISSLCVGQQFSCMALVDDIAKWNKFSGEYQFDVFNWSQVIIDSSLYRINEAGDIEFDYVIRSSDTLDLPRLKELTLDFIAKKFNINNNSRSELVQGSTDRSVFFKGKYGILAYQDVFLSRYYFDSDIFFNIKFKEDRIRFIVSVPFLVYHIGDYTFQYEFLHLDPWQNYSSLKKQDKETHARAMINVLGKTWSYPSQYMLFLNENYKSAVSDEDW